MNRLHRLSIPPLLLLLAACGEPAARSSVIEVTNPLDVARGPETVAIPWGHVTDLLHVKLASAVGVVDVETGALLLTQLVDTDHDSHPDGLLFQVELGPRETRSYALVEGRERGTFTAYAGGRAVPERDDDFAWENDRVAFRTYGADPEEGGDPRTSGIDCWLKRVSRPILDRWYALNAVGQSYHEDRGEGYDPYEVGASRGCGGIAVWKDGRMYPSTGYRVSRILEHGPLRFTCELVYDPWEVGDEEVSLVERLSLDLGSRLSRFEAHFFVDGRPAPQTVAIGLTTHDGAAEAKASVAERWLRAWEVLDGSGLGTGVVLASAPKEALELDEEGENADHLVFVADTDREGVIAWYSGYGWERAGEITTAPAWDGYLSAFAAALREPLRVEVKKE